MTLRPPAASQTDPRGFVTTRWSVVVRAQSGGAQDARQAMDLLFRTYWTVLFRYACRIGHSKQDAEDRVQGFFTELLEKGYLRAADRNRGRFRSFLLTCFKHFLSHATEYERAVRRGGRCSFVSLDDERLREPAWEQASGSLSPEARYDSDWALTLLATALARLKQDQVEAGRGKHFELLKCFLSAEGTGAAYEAVAAELGISRNAVAVAVHRLRQRLGRFVREEVAETIANPDDLDEELNYLIRLMLETPDLLAALPRAREIGTAQQ